MASQVAGVSRLKGAVMPLSARLARTASLMANNTEAARNRGGSPTAYIYIQWRQAVIMIRSGMYHL